jgi:hypothetical protein
VRCPGRISTNLVWNSAILDAIWVRRAAHFMR